MTEGACPPGLAEYFGHYGGASGPWPSIVGKYAGRTLIVCGDAACIWDDLDRLGCKCTAGRGVVRAATVASDFMVINKLGEVFPGDIEHWYSNEGTKLMAFVAARRHEYSKEFSSPGHTHSINKGAKWRWPFGGHGTSGLNAILVGLALGYDRIIACGIPLDNSPHNGEPPWRRCNFLNEVSVAKDGAVNSHWKHAIKTAFNGRVKMMSGRAKEWVV